MYILILIIWIHFISDFAFQSDQMALNKSENINWLGIHCMVYSIPFLIIGLEFALITCGAHFIVDYITSKITKYFWEKNERHWFFVTIGIDQAIHLTCLILTLKFLYH